MSENRPASRTSERITPAGNWFLILWAIGLILLTSFATYFFANRVYQNKQASVEHHNQRISATIAESGRTESERTPPPGFENAVPIDVTIGIYIDRVSNLSIPDQAWTVDFYLWFRWT